MLCCNITPVKSAARTKMDAVRALAHYYIDLYFQDKKYDESIDLYTMRFVKMVIGSSIEGGVHLIYDCLGVEFAGRKLSRKQYREKLIAMYKECCKMGIPKEYATGLLLMEYVVCKEIDIFDDE